MIGKAGERIIVESMHVGGEPRVGEIMEVVPGEAGVHYRVRWSDGHESLFTPQVGSARIERVEEARPV